MTSSILDLLMPTLDGRTVLRRILERKPGQAVLVLSALTDTQTKVEVLELGAEDYLAKPFSLAELLARVRARLRGVARSGAGQVRAGTMSLDLVRREAELGNGPIPLSERESLLLRELMQSPGVVVSKERLLSAVWGYHFEPGSNVVDVYVRRLRSKLGAGRDRDRAWKGVSACGGVTTPTGRSACPRSWTSRGASSRSRTWRHVPWPELGDGPVPLHLGEPDGAVWVPRLAGATDHADARRPWCVTTGVILYHDYAIGAQSLDELTEVPLMAAMFVAMVWHARRHLAATEKVRRVSEQNERLLEREHAFLQDASHELRTPITIALGHAELLQRSHDDPLRGRGRAGRGRGAPAAGPAGRPAPDPRLARAAGVPASHVGRPGSLRRRAGAPLGAHAEGVATRTSSTRRSRRADPDRLQLALDAIVENAVKHTGPQDVISFSLRRSGERIIISVADTGTGIPPEDLQRIFERFSRAAPDPSSPRRGSGLGLSIAKAVVEAHGGTIDVRSEPGRGSVFRITLPVDRAALPHDGAARDPAGDRATQSDRASSRSPLSAGAAFAEPIADPS